MQARHRISLVAASLALALAGCSDGTGSSNGGNGGDGAKIYWIGSDYATGELRAAVDGEATDLALEVYQDSKVFSFDGKVFVLERAGADNIVRIDPAADTVMYQESLGAGANPYDIVAADDSTALVALNGADKAVFVGIADGKAKKSVKLDRFAATGGQANPSAIAVVGGKAYVALERMAGYVADPVGMLAVIDLESRALVDSVKLDCVDPIDVEPFGGKLIVACKGTSSFDADYNETSNEDGKLLSVDPATFDTVTLATEKNLKAKPSELAAGDDLWVALYRSFGDEPVARLAIGKNELSVNVFDGVGDAFGGLSAKGDRLAVGDRAFGNEAVRVLDGDKIVETLGGEKGSLPPYSVTFLK